MYRTSMDPPPSISPPFYSSCLLAVAVTVTVTVKVTVNVTVTVVRVSPPNKLPTIGAARQWHPFRVQSPVQLVGFCGHSKSSLSCHSRQQDTLFECYLWATFVVIQGNRSAEPLFQQGPAIIYACDACRTQRANSRCVLPSASIFVRSSPFYPPSRLRGPSSNWIRWLSLFPATLAQHPLRRRSTTVLCLWIMKCYSGFLCLAVVALGRATSILIRPKPHAYTLRNRAGVGITCRTSQRKISLRLKWPYFFYFGIAHLKIDKAANRWRTCRVEQ